MDQGLNVRLPAIIHIVEGSILITILLSTLCFVLFFEPEHLAHTEYGILSYNLFPSPCISTISVSAHCVDYLFYLQWKRLRWLGVV